MLKFFFPLLYQGRKIWGKVLGELFLFTRRVGVQPSYGGVPLPLRTDFELPLSKEAEMVPPISEERQVTGQTVLTKLPRWTNRAEFLDVCRGDNLLVWPDSDLFRLNSASVFGPDGVIVGENGSFFPELCRRPGPRPTPQYPLDHPIYTSWFGHGAEVLDGSVAVLSGSSPDVYFHWIFDILPKWRLLAEVHAKNPFLTVLVGGRPSKFKSETLALLGIPPEIVRYLGEEKQIFFCAEVYAVSETGAGNHFPIVIAEFIGANLRGSAPIRKNQFARIFIDRNDAKRRRIICPNYLEALRKHHFEIISASEYSVQEQAEIFRNAEIVAALHGSALSNLVFCEPGTKVIELLPGDYTNVVFWKLSSVMKLEYSAIVGKGSCSETGNVFSDFVIDSKAFEEALDDVIQNFDSNEERN